MKKIWITGAEGHIGTALLELLEGVEYQLLPTDIHEVDITKIDEVTQFVYVNRPDVIINWRRYDRTLPSVKRISTKPIASMPSVCVM